MVASSTAPGPASHTSHTPSGTRLHRSSHEKVVFGVCGGLAEYFEIDPVIVRLIFILLTISGGAGLLAYIILAAILPAEEAPVLQGREALRHNLEDLREEGEALAHEMRDPVEALERRHRHQQVGALVLIGLGLIFLASTLDWIPHVRGEFLWPLVLIVIGAAILLQGQRAHRI